MVKHKFPFYKLKQGGEGHLQWKLMQTVIKADTGRWKDLPGPCIEWINLVKMTITPKSTYRFSAVHIKTPMTLFTKVEKYGKHKRTRITKTFLNNRNNAKSITTPISNDNIEQIVIKLLWYLCKNKHVDHWNRRQVSNTGLCNFSHRIFTR